MKYLAEISSNVSGEILTEEKTGEKKYYLRGVFGQAESVNQNGRKYPKRVLETAVAEYVRDYVSKRKSLSELEHPEYLEIKAENAAILIEDLQWRGNDLVGSALVLNTPKGNIIKALIEGGVQLSMSTRGAGDLTVMEGYKIVNEGYKLMAIDSVMTPSCSAANVSGILENKEFIFESGRFIEVQPKKSKIDEQKLLESFKNLLNYK